MSASGNSLTTGAQLPSRSDGIALTSPQKAALIIAALGPEAAGPIMERINDNHLRAFARAYAHLQTVPRVELIKVIAEFVSKISRSDDSIQGGFDQTRELLSQFKSADDIIRLMDDISVPGGESIWDKLERVDEAALAAYLGKQRPQIVAVVLSKLNTEHASRILDMLASDLAGQVILRLSKPLTINRNALRILTETIEEEFLAPMRSSSETRNPGEMIGSMLNNVMSEKRDELLAVITENSPEIMSAVRKSMLTFQDIATRVPPNAITLAIKEVDISDFLRAVKFGRQNAPSSVEFIFANISQRMAKQYEEQIEELKPSSVEESEAAQSKFMTVIRRLANNGEITLIEAEEGDDEEGSPDSENADSEAAA